MAYTEDKEPSGLSTLTTLDDTDRVIVGDTSDTSEVVKTITWANVKTMLSSLYAAALGADDNYVTDAEKTKLANLSGTNTGDQTIANSSDATSHTVTLSGSGGSVQLIEGTNITLTTGGTASAGTVTIAASGGSAGGDVSKVGTPVNNQVGVWTGDGTLEGDTALTFDTTDDTLAVGGKVTTPEVRAASSAGLAVRSNSGSLVADFGAGGGQNATFEDGTTIKGLLTVGSGTTSGTVQSNGNHDLTLKTGNATTGSITITDGANGNITAALNGSGELVVDGGKLYMVSDNIKLNSGNGIEDNNNNEQLIFTTTGSAVNHVRIVNAATGNAPQIVADGDDTNVSLQLSPKGSGSIRIASLTGVLRADSGVVSTDSDVTDIVAAASDTAAGKVELATDAETVTGSATDRATTPANITAKLAAPGAIGGTTPSTAQFTTLTTTGNIELGHASDTTITRVSAGVIAVEGTNVSLAGHTHEGTAILSTGEAGGTKFLREDGDGTCSWQTPPSSSGISRTVVVTSGSATMGSAAATDYMYFVAGAHTMSLPAASGNTNLYTIKNNHSANITVDTIGAETIDGAASISVAPEESVGIISNGTNFNII